MFSNRKKIKIQGKTAAHKHALVKSQVIELIRNSKIKTTPTKAKLLKATFDKLVTKYKKDTTHSKNQIVSFLGNKNVRSYERFEKIVSEKLMDRNSGYTKVVKTTPRSGDAAAQVIVMLVNSEAKAKKSKIQATLEKQEAKPKAKKKSAKTAEKKVKTEKKK